MTFKQLSIGQQFDWIDDNNRMANSFYLRCTKITARKYVDERGTEYKVGSVSAKVFHVTAVTLCADSRVRGSVEYINMARFTKKQMVEDYERLYNHANLLELYLYDTQLGRKPDAIAQDGKGQDKVTVQLWRANSPSGGYVVIMGCAPSIWLLDVANDMFRDDYSPHRLAIRTCLERVTVVRNKMVHTAA